MFAFFHKNPDSPPGMIWMISTLILVLVFVGILIYEIQPNLLSQQQLEAQVQNGQQLPSQPSTITLPITIIYNAAVPGQQQDIQIFLDSLTNQETGLKATTIKDVLIDFNTAEGQQVIQESESKYLPLAFFDKSIEQHPQFSDINSYLKKIGNRYFFHLRPLEYLQIPSYKDGYIKGADPAQAKIVIVEYGSFTCHFCQQMEEVLAKIMKDYAGKISLIYKHLDRGGPDSTIAQGAECAGEQDKFWEMHKQLFADQENMLKLFSEQSDTTTAVEKKLRDYLEKKARDVGVNGAKFLECLDSGRQAKVVEDQTREAGEFGISGTPAFFINQELSDGASSYEDFKARIENVLAQEQE